MPHATRQELADWLSSDAPLPSEEEQDRLLKRATTVVNAAAVARHDPEAGAVSAALRDATCAQVEQWLAVNEGVDIEGWPAETHVQASGLSVNRPPDTLAPRARRILAGEGLTQGGMV